MWHRTAKSRCPSSGCCRPRRVRLAVTAGPARRRRPNGPARAAILADRGGDAPRGRVGAARPGSCRPRVWQPKAPAKSDNLSFEDMMSRFKSQSEEKMADLDHETNNRRGGDYRYPRRGR